MIESPRVCKILVIGDSNVGKTSMIRCIHEKRFSEQPSNTITTDLYGISNFENTVHIQLIDTPGNHTLRGSWQTLRKKAPHGVLLLYDITNQKTFESMNEMYKHIKQDDKDFPVVFVGTKLDLLPLREVQSVSNLMKGMCSSDKNVIEVSSKENRKVKEALLLLLGKIKKRHPKMFRLDENKVKQTWFKFFASSTSEHERVELY